MANSERHSQAGWSPGLSPELAISSRANCRLPHCSALCQGILLQQPTSVSSQPLPARFRAQEKLRTPFKKFMHISSANTCEYNFYS